MKRRKRSRQDSMPSAQGRRIIERFGELCLAFVTKREEALLGLVNDLDVLTRAFGEDLVLPQIGSVAPGFWKVLGLPAKSDDLTHFPTPRLKKAVEEFLGSYGTTKDETKERSQKARKAKHRKRRRRRKTKKTVIAPAPEELKTPRKVKVKGDTLSFSKLRDEVVNAIRSLKDGEFSGHDVRKVLKSSNLKFNPNHLSQILFGYVEGITPGSKKKIPGVPGRPQIMYKVTGDLAASKKKIERSSEEKK